MLALVREFKDHGHTNTKPTM